IWRRSMPCGGRSGRVSQPERLRMQPWIRPPSNKCADYIGLIGVCKIRACGGEAVERSEGSMFPHLLHSPRTTWTTMQPLGRGQNVILRKKLLLTLGRCIDHLLDTVRSKERIELRSIHLAIDQ